MEGLLGSAADFTVSSLIASLLFSSIGVWLFKKSREKLNVKLTVLGVGLFFWPYVSVPEWITWAGGIAMCLLARLYWFDD